MKYIEQSFTEIVENNFFDKIGLVAHNCYQVDNNNNSELFVKKLIGYGHFAMMEHYQFVLQINKDFYQELIQLNNPFIILVSCFNNYYASFSIRVILENVKLENSTTYLKLLYCLPNNIQQILEGVTPIKVEGKLLTEEEINNLPKSIYEKVKFVTIKIITDRGVSHELVRHRIASYAQESTRYCNYSRAKFGNELTFIKPLDYDLHQQDYDYIFSNIEKEYIHMTNDLHLSAEMARAILPNKLKTSIIITCSISEYLKIFALRCAKNAHPDIQLIMNQIKDYFISKGYITNEDR